jgi:flagellar biosynthesis chaperone FliJ
MTQKPISYATLVELLDIAESDVQMLRAEVGYLKEQVAKLKQQLRTEQDYSAELSADLYGEDA